MTRTQILALLLGASLAVIGGVLAWQGLLPGVPPLQPRIVSPTALSPKAKPAQVAPAVAAKPQPIIPQFDTVRVEPSGETVVAGHGEPNAKTALMAGEAVLGEAQANAGGDFVIVPQPLAPGDYVLSLRSGSATAAMVQSQQTITVSVPAKGQKGVVVALTEPGKPSQLLADPTAQKRAGTEKQGEQGKGETSPSQASEPKLSVAVKTAEVDKGGFYTAGFAPPGTHLRIYLNGSALADVVADAEGRWSLTSAKGVTAGHYVVRADAIDTEGKVIARAEVPFDVPVAIAEAGAPKAGAARENSKGGDGRPKLAAAATPRPGSSRAVVPRTGTATVARGDSLWRISRNVFGHGIRYTSIYQANASEIRDPNLIYPGQVFILPH